MAKLFPPGYQFSDLDGRPLSGGGVVFYQAGTTTLKSVYTDTALASAATNSSTTTPKGQPLDSAGRFSQGDLYGSGTYTIVAFDRNGATIWSRDDFISQDAVDNTSYYETGYTASLQSHPGIITGHIIKTNYHGGSSGTTRTTGSGGDYQFTGSTVGGRAGDWPNADGYFYDADGKRFTQVDEINIKCFGAVGNATNDDTSAIQSAVTAATVYGTSGGVYVPTGRYLVTSTVTVNSDGIRIHGDGMRASRFKFEPTADDVCFLFDKGSAQGFQNGMYHCGFDSADTTYEKTAIKIIDQGDFYCENIGTTSPHWLGAGSIGIHILGRDLLSFRDILFAADRPIVISAIPAPHTHGNIGIDHANFHNSYLLGQVGYPCIEVEDGIRQLSNVSFTGHQAWVGGEGGFKFVDSTPVSAHTNISFDHVRFEGSDAPDTTYFMHIDLTGGSALKSLMVNGGQTGVTKGFYFRNIDHVGIHEFLCTESSREVMNADTTVEPIEFRNCFWRYAARLWVCCSTVLEPRGLRI